MRTMFRGGLLVVLATSCVTIAAARSSPQADSIQELLKNIDARYSDNVFVDANLNVVSESCVQQNNVSFSPA